MKERNKCIEAGCGASCCKGPYFSGSYTERKVLEWFPEAKKVKGDEFTETKEKGVYYRKDLFGNATVRIVGPCPNLSPDNYCMIYKNRPPDCANMVVGSKKCSEFRFADERGMPQPIPVDEIRTSSAQK